MIEETTYIPGTCNIGKEEVQRRKRIMIASLAFSIIFMVTGQLLHFSPALKAVLFLPLATFILCAQQTYRRFCVAFGLKGLFNFEKPGNIHVTRNADHLKKDRALAWQIILISIISALVLTAVYTLI